MAGTITTRDVTKARAELDRMKVSLGKWLKYRTLNDQAMRGTAPSKVGPGAARQIVGRRRSSGAERKLAAHLHALLSELEPDATLPDPTAPGAAVALAKSALSPSLITGGSSSSGMGSIPGWVWPVAIVTGLLLAVTTAIKSQAEVQLAQEKTACIEAGACTDDSFWLKWGAIAFVAWLVWKELGVGVHVKALVAKGGSRS